MTPADLDAWMKRRGLTQTQVAAEFHTTQGHVSEWLNGHRPIPWYVARIVALLDRIEALEQAASAAQPE